MALTDSRDANSRPRPALRWMAPLAAVGLVACGSSAKNQCVATASASSAARASLGRFAPSSTLSAKCAVPRSGIDPLTCSAFPDKQGSLDDEKLWLRSWNDELYLWYSEVPQAVLDAPTDATAYPTAIDYFKVLMTPLQLAGKAKDQFHFTLATDAWEQLSQSGVQAGYGVQWVLLANTPPRRALAAYVEKGSQAEKAGIKRGAEVITVDGVPVVDGADTATLNEGLFPTVLGKPHTLVLQDFGAAAPNPPVTLTPGNVSSATVPIAAAISSAPSVGYVLFNDHFATAEGELFTAISALKAAAVTDLVVDLRYNGGGLLDIASELAFMIAGPGPTAGKTFEKTTFSDKYPTTNPVTGDPLVPTRFHATTLGFSLVQGQALPHLDLPRVFVLTGSGTCSASESIINSLQGIGVQVIQVGSTTCGKPYGFYPQDNCGTTYFSIQFKGVNAAGFGDYPNGFSPGGTGDASPPGCAVSDDFGHALGDPAESRLAAALYYRANGVCPPVAAPLARGLSTAAADVIVPKGPWRENRIVRR